MFTSTMDSADATTSIWLQWEKNVSEDVEGDGHTEDFVDDDPIEDFEDEENDPTYLFVNEQGQSIEHRRGLGTFIHSLIAVEEGNPFPRTN